MIISKGIFGKTSAGETAELYTLDSGTGMKVEVSTLGGVITKILVPDKNGKETDVVLGYDSPVGYEQGTCFLGALIGRHANRIKGGKISLGGREYNLFRNDGNNHLHGGKAGFDRKIWSARVTDGALVLSYISKDGEEGYPGNLIVTVSVSLSEDHTLSFDYTAVCDQDTVCNLTNHSYFNLAGHASGSVTGQYIQIFADYYTPADKESLPTGEIARVEDTPMDLRAPVKIGEHIDDDYYQLKFGGGYDHNWIIDGVPGELRKMAFAYDEGTGISLTGYTTMPGMQFYSGNYLGDAGTGKGGTRYDKRWGFCLESQYYPNSMAIGHFKKPVLRAGDIFRETTSYRFGLI
ncbi:MAG TPA: galactose-1-epimerase [Ruminococcaceae bacterium]|nr:galactose-1-epimerase [Oscillospiraceae bacterium]